MAAKQYSSIDIAKFIACLLVIGIHTDLDLAFGAGAYTVYYDIFNLAVPFFFAASGFFLGRKVYGQPRPVVKETIKNFCSRLLLKFVVFEGVMSVLYLILQFSAHADMGAELLKLLKWWIVFPYGAMWYLLASIVGALLLYPFLKRNKLRLALIVGAVLYGVSLLANSYYGFIADTGLAGVVDTYMTIFETTHNGVFEGFFFLALGVACHRVTEVRQYAIRPKIAVVITGAVWLLYVAETHWLYRLFGETTPEKGLFVLLPFVTVCLLLTLCTLTCRITPERSKTLRQLSIGMYLLHMPVIWVFDRGINLLRHFGFAAILDHTGLVAVARFVVAAVVSWWLCRLVLKSKKEPFYRLLT